MKQLYLALALLCFSFVAFSQNTPADYAFTTDFQVSKWDDAQQNIVVDKTIYRVKRGDIFTLRQHYTITVGNKQIKGWRIEFWQFGKGRRQVQPNAEELLKIKRDEDYQVIVVDSVQNNKYFFIADDDLKDNATTDFRKPNSLLKVDGLVLPIKLRFRNSQPGGVFDFTQSINIGLDIAKTWNKGGAFGTTSFSILAGLNITNVPVDEKTVPGVITGKTTLLGISPNIGFNFEYKSINFGLMSGIDILAGEAGAKWAYRNSPWLGLSIGTSLVNIISPAKKQ